MREEEEFHKTVGRKQVEEKNICTTDGIRINGYIGAVQVCLDCLELFIGCVNWNVSW